MASGPYRVRRPWAPRAGKRPRSRPRRTIRSCGFPKRRASTPAEGGSKSLLQEARDAAGALKATLSGIEDALIQTRVDSPLSYPFRLNAKLAALAHFVDSADAAPTRQAYEVFDDLAARLDAQLTRLRDVTATDLAAVNRLIRHSDVPPITPAAAQEAASATGA